MSGIIKFTCLVLIAVALVAAVGPRSEAAISCRSVASYMQACLPYLTNKGQLGRCCGGVKGLYGAAKTRRDRQAVCNCLKSLARGYRGIDFRKAAALPGQCGVRLPYKISPSTDCSRVP